MGGLSSFAGNLTGGLIGTSDAERSSGRLSGLSEKAKGEIMSELGSSWEDIKGFLQPYLESGQQALGEYRQAIGAAPDAPVFEGFEFDPENIQNNPAYQFVRDEALQAVNRSAAGNRALTSGNRAIALQNRAAGLASTEYGNEFGRQLQQYQTREGAKGRNFDVRNLLQRQRVGDFGNLMSQGVGTATNLSSFRQNLAQQRAGAQSNYAAEQGAAMLLPVQEKQQFVQGLMSAGGQAAGAFFGA